MRRVLAFGSFDPLHDGHRSFFQQARVRGDYLTVVVARDAAIFRQKQHRPRQPEAMRLNRVAREPLVDAAQLGEMEPDSYQLLATLDFDVLALGYDQAPADDEVRRLLAHHGKDHVEVVRLQPYKPEEYKSSRLRT